MSDLFIQRLAKDIKNILRDPINNIYYKHDEDNLTKGYALIIGPHDTPYQNGYYFFEFTFPDNYPFLPPKVKYYTNDGFTRFNPNFYICGKVCLSILNTWKGEGWTSCQNIRSVLLSLQCAMNDKPLLNEPGITEQHRDYNNYNLMLRYKNIEVAILNILNDKNFDKKFFVFKDKILEHYRINRDTVIKDIEFLKTLLSDNTCQKFGIYASEYIVNFNKINNLLLKADTLI